jgi:glycosyltransferase involved in cell wall biosynthesis
MGFLKNCNRSAARARGKYLLLLNNDTNVQPGWLSALVDVAERDPNVAIVGPMLLYPNGRLQEAGGIIWSDATGHNYGRGHYAELPEYNYLKEVDYISGACLLIRKCFWDDVGGFDERFAPAYYEDTDLAFQARSKGLKIIYQPLSRVVHYEGVSHGRDELHGIKAFQRVNREKFLDKWKDALGADHLKGHGDIFLARDRSHGRKTVLFVDHHVPMKDKDAGSKSTFQYLTLMSELGYNVKFIGDNFVDHQPYATEMQQLGIEVLYGRSYRRNWSRWLSANGKHIHYVVLSRPQIAPKYVGAVRHSTRAKVIYWAHDLHYLREARRHDVEKSNDSLRETRRLDRIETEILRNVDLVYLYSSAEAVELKRKVPDTSVRVIPLFFYGKTDFAGGTAPLLTGRHTLLFVGGFVHPPNIDGVCWFAANVLPIIRQQMPDIELRVVGALPPAKVVNHLKAQGVVALGHASEAQLQYEYQQARVVVAPLRFGAGIKGKIVEAMRYGVPVVTTSVGAEGIGSASEGLSVADDANAFANAVWQLCQDNVAWSVMSERSISTIQKSFSKDAAKNILLADMPIH